MTPARPQLGSRADIDLQVGALRQAGRHIQPVSWHGQLAWLKLSTPPPTAWRYQLQAGVAGLLGLPAMRPVRPQGGAAGIGNEADLLTRLADAGLRVPALLERGDHWLLMSELGQTTLDSLIRDADPAARLAYWQQGADYIQRVHRAGQYLSQAFARNLVWSAEHGLGAIDFEDDPITAMPLAHAQVRDWLPFLFSTAIYFKDSLPALCATVEGALDKEDAAVRRGVYAALHRTAWLRSLRWLPPGMQRNDVLKTHSYGELARLCRQRSSPPREP